MASNRSSNPPWPGKIVPESLILAERLRYDSKISPANAMVQMIALSAQVCQPIFLFCTIKIIHNNNVVAANPPHAPSHDLPGLIAGIIFVVVHNLLQIFPEKYDALSKQNTRPSNMYNKNL